MVWNSTMSNDWNAAYQEEGTTELRAVEKIWVEEKGWTSIGRSQNSSWPWVCVWGGVTSPPHPRALPSHASESRIAPLRNDTSAREVGDEKMHGLFHTAVPCHCQCPLGMPPCATPSLRLWKEGLKCVLSKVPKFCRTKAWGIWEEAHAKQIVNA